MTKNEAGAIVKMISTFYPNEYAKLTPEAMAMVVEMWAVTCEVYTGEQIAAAFQQFMATDVKGYGPKPGQLIQLICEPEDEKDLNENDAWSLVARATGNGIYGAKEEFDKLPPLVQRAVGNDYNIHEMAMRELTSVDESSFKRTYRELLARERQKRRMPPSTWKRLEGGDEPLGLPV